MKLKLNVFKKKKEYNHEYNPVQISLSQALFIIPSLPSNVLSNLVSCHSLPDQNYLNSISSGGL